MEIKEITKWLLDNGYLVLVNSRPILTAKFERELGYQSTPQELTPVQISNELTKPTTYTNDPKIIWNAFITDADIPHRVKSTDGTSYTVRQYGALVAKKLMKIIEDPRIDYKRLTESTRNYYKTTSYKLLLSNYIVKDIWYHEYQNWGTKQQVHTGDGGNRWERE